MSLLRWIWGLLKQIGHFVLKGLEWLWLALTSLVTWICAAIAYVIEQIYEWFEDLVDNFCGLFEDMAFEQFPQSTPLASWLLHDVVAIDVAFEVLAAVALVWIAAKLARLAMVPIRAVLDIV